MATGRYHTEKVGENSNGNYLYCADSDVTVFEDVTEGPAYYAWNGDADQHDAAAKTGLYETADEAIDAAIAIYNATAEAEDQVERAAAALNTYAGENLWEDVVRGLEGYNDDATAWVDPAGRGDRVVLSLGGRLYLIRRPDSALAWVRDDTSRAVERTTLAVWAADNPNLVPADAYPSGRTELTDAERGEIETAARETAKLFVDEFGEPLDPAATDWDGEAWAHDRTAFSVALRQALDRSDPLYDEAWRAYDAALVAETERLCGEAE